MLAGRAAPAPAAVHSGVLSTDPQEVRPKVTLPGAKSAGDADVISVQKTEETRIRAVLIFKKAQAEMRRRRRMIRSVCFLLNLLFITLFWALGTGINHPVMYHQAYDPAYLVTIELAGCDLYFVPGDTADIKFTALAKAVDFGGPAWRNHPIDSDSYAQGGEFLNVLDEACSMVPLNNCSRVCKIEITVPPSAAGVADFHVYQLAGDNALAPYVYVQPGVSFKSLYVGTWFRRAPTLNIELTGATVGTLDMYLRHGDFRSVNSSVDTYRVRCAGTGARGCLGEVAKSLCITARLDALSARRFRHLPPLQERRKARATLVVPPPPTQPLPLPITLIAHILRITGSIYLLDMPVIDTPVKTKWRQPSNRFCAASDLPTATFVAETDPAQNGCDLSGVLSQDQNTDNWLNFHRTRGIFDANDDGRVQRSEFLDGVYQYTCCGGNAPFSCFCDELAYIIFPPRDETYFDRFDLTVTQFVERLFETNNTRFIGSPGVAGCHESVEAHTGSAAIGPSVTVFSESGEIVVTLRQASDGAEGHYNQSVYVPKDKRSGIELLQADAQRLLETYGKSVGERTSTDEIYLVIDAAMAGSGLPRTRWIYVTNPTYAVLDPARLRALSNGQLTPKVAYERVRFSNNKCLLDFPLNESAYNLTLSDMHYQIFRSLHGSAHDKSPLRGDLFLVTGGLDGDSYVLNAFPYGRETPDGEQARVWPQELDTLRSLVYSSAILSIIFGAIAGFNLMLVVKRFLHNKQEEAVKRRKADRLMTLAHHYPTLKVQDIAKQIDDLYLEDDDNTITCDPLDRPLGILTELFIHPLERQYVDSFARFCKEKVTKTDTGLALKPFDVHEGCSGCLLGFVGTATCIGKVLLALVPRGNGNLIKKLKGAAGETGKIGPRTAESESAKPNEACISKGQFVYLRQLLNEYEIFCLENDLPVVADPAEVQRRLVLKYDVRIRQLEVSRLRGLKWRAEVTEPLMNEHGSVPTPRSHGPDDPVARHVTVNGLSSDRTDPSLVAPPANWVRLFINECCTVNKQPEDWIDMKTRMAPSCIAGDGTAGYLKLGFRQVLRAWCKEHKFAMPDVYSPENARLWTEHLPPGVTFKDDQRVRQVYGITWQTNTAPESLSLSCDTVTWSFYVFEALAVLLHCVVLLGSAFLLTLLASSIQDDWAKTVMPPSWGLEGIPLLSLDVLRPLPVIFVQNFGVEFPETVSGRVTSFRVNRVAELLFWEAISLACASLVRMAYSYMNPPLGSVVRVIIVQGYAVIATLHILLCASLLGVQLAWSLFASCIRPTRYLPYGTALVSLVIACRAIGVDMTRASRIVVHRVKRILFQQLSTKLQQARDEIVQQAAERVGLEATNGRREYRELDDKLGPGKHATSTRTKETSAAHIFQLLLESHEAESDKNWSDEDVDVDVNNGENAIRKGDFRRLFLSLDLNMTTCQVGRLFAMTDLDGSGTVTLKEFEAGWHMLSDEIIKARLESLGLSQEQIFFQVCSAAVGIIILVAFLLITLQSWLDQNSFEALAQSALVGLVSSGVAKLRARSQVKTEELEAKIENYMSADGEINEE